MGSLEFFICGVCCSKAWITKPLEMEIPWPHEAYSFVAEQDQNHGCLTDGIGIRWHEIIIKLIYIIKALKSI